MNKYCLTAVLLLLCAALTACSEAAIGTVTTEKLTAAVSERATFPAAETEITQTPQTETETAATETETEAATETETEAATEAPPEEGYEALNYTDIKAMWLSQYDLNGVYTASGAQRPEDKFREILSVVLDNVVKNHYNTVIVQVRPFADSMYPSEIYPPSYIVTGKYGNEFSYDAFGIIVEEAHKRELSVHAWINPMRAMTESEIKLVSGEYRIKQWYGDQNLRKEYLPVVSGRVYLNVGYEEVRQMIIDGANEILSRYDVDGLHMDDYFYPTTDASFDSGAYGKFRAEGGKGSLAAFRKNALSELVAALYTATKASGRGRLFGISPAGVMDKVINNQYADVKKWCGTEGYLDYICPQVYFGLEHQTADFVKICDSWRDMIKVDGLKLIIGMSLGKAKSGYDQYAGSGKNEWAQHKDILLRCLKYTETLDKCEGVCYFCYQYFYDPVTGREEQATRAERNNFIPYLQNITWH